MARRIRAEHNVTDNQRKRARANADGKLAGKKSAPALPLERTTHLALPSDEIYVTQMAKVQAAKRRYEKAKSDAKAATSDARTKYDEVKVMAVAALAGRSVSKTSFERMIVLETRRAAKGEEEVSAEIKGEAWMLRAGGFEVGEQMLLFPESVKNEKDALAKAKKAGIEIGVKAGSVSENPFHPGSAPGQSWLEGYHEGQASNAAKFGQTPKASTPKAANTVTNLAEVKAKRAKVQEKRGAIAAVPVVVTGEAQAKRGRGRPRKVVAAVDTALVAPEIKAAAE